MRSPTDDTETHGDSAAFSSSCEPFSLACCLSPRNLCFHFTIAYYNGYHILIFIYAHAMRITWTPWQ
ncbi:hypothetical protein E2C01_089906 [Portunus trituberculatus]|uniref:Uncharacterized protein n=1 Tax=Portunus trituberculatus TaxID=210409 RepID=A0A5B7JJI4_PORTR|nr:hypothetical protein [Portunus trituberculatus]